MQQILLLTFFCQSLRVRFLLSGFFTTSALCLRLILLLFLLLLILLTITYFASSHISLIFWQFLAVHITIVSAFISRPLCFAKRSIIIVIIIIIILIFFTSILISSIITFKKILNSSLSLKFLYFMLFLMHLYLFTNIVLWCHFLYKSCNGFFEDIVAVYGLCLIRT